MRDLTQHKKLTDVCSNKEAGTYFLLLCLSVWPSGKSEGR